MITSLFVSALFSMGGEDAFPDTPRMEVLLNGPWQFTPGDIGWFSEASPRVRVPGAFQRDDVVEEVCAWYRRAWPMPDALRDDKARWFLRFDKAGWYTRAEMNGEVVGENYGSYLPFEFDVTEVLRWGQENELKVFVHAADATHTLPDVTLPGLLEAMGYRTGGRHHRNWAQIAGDVTLEKRPACHIAYHRAETSFREKSLRVLGEVSHPLVGGQVLARVYDLDTGEEVLAAQAYAGENFDLNVPWEDAAPWGFGPYGSPKLYALRLDLTDGDGAVIDTVVSRFGFREIWYEGQTLLFNGRPLMLTAATIPHDFTPLPPYRFPYGPFEPNQFTRWAQALRAHGWNAAHNHFDTFGTGIYDVADELGLPVVAGLYCAGPSWLTPASKAGPHWPGFMKDQIRNWTRILAAHPSVVMYSLMDGLPGPAADMPLERMRALLDETGTITGVDTTRPVVGGDVDFIKQGIGEIRAEAKRSFADNGKPRFIKEVWAIDAGNPYSTNALPGLLPFMEDHAISGFVSFGKGFPPFPFQVSWPSAAGEGVRWQTRLATLGFTGWLNWCDQTQPLHQPSDVGEMLRDQYVPRWGSPGDTEPLVYPDILSDAHGPGVTMVGIEPLCIPGLPPRFTLVDDKGTAMLHVRYPGKVRVHALGIDHRKTALVDAPRLHLPYAPGYQQVITAAWEQTKESPVAVRLEGTENGQHFPVLKIHLTRHGEDAGYVNVRFPETIQANEAKTGRLIKFYQDLRSPAWPAKLACEPVGLPVEWETSDTGVAYTMELDNGMRLHASATLDNDEVTLRYLLDNATETDLEQVCIWSCIQMQLAPPLNDPLMERTCCQTDDGFALMRSLVPNFKPYARDKAVNHRFSAYLPGVPNPYGENPYVADHPGFPGDPEQRVWFWTVTEPIPRAAMATVAQDGTWAVVTQGEGARGVWTNPGISCHHADPIGEHLPAGGSVTISNTVRFVEGGLPNAQDQ